MYIRNLNVFYLIVLNLSVFITVTIYIHFYLVNDRQSKGSKQTFLHLNDLENVKLSLRNELQYLETKRSVYINELSLIKRKIRFFNQSFLKLRKQFDLFESKLENRKTQFTELVSKISQKSILVSNYEFLIKKQPLDPIKLDSDSIEACLNLNHCFSNSIPKFFILNNDEIKLNFYSLQQSFSLTDSADQSCFCVIFLTREQNLVQLKKILANFSDKTNLIFINDYSKSQHTITRQELISKFNDPSIEPKIKCSIFVSFSPRDTLSLNFGLLGTKHLTICDLTAKRNFLFFNKYNLNSSKSNIFFEIYKNFSNSYLSQVTELDVILKCDFEIFIPNENRVETIVDLVEALNSGTIPVLFDLEFELPLSNLIAWDEIAIRLSFHEMNKLPIILGTVTKHELIQRRIKARMIYKSYFRSKTDQLKTILAALKDKIRLSASPIFDFKPLEFKHFFAKTKLNLSHNFDDEYLGEVNSARQNSLFFQSNYSQFLYKKWNLVYFPFNLFPSDPFFVNYLSEFSSKGVSESQGGGDGKFFHSHLSGNFDKLEQFTMVVLTFNREKILVKYLEKYLKTIPYLNSILVVWNSASSEPKWILWQNVSFFIQIKRLRILKMERNSLNNRFLPFDLIGTEAVLSLDDDVYLRPDEIVFAFRVWRENRDRIVGFPARYHTFNTTSQQFMYKSYLSCEYSLVLTGAAFYHKFYNYYYSFINDREIRHKVDELMNCEDIAFNMMVAHLTRKAPIKVTTKYSFYCSDCENLVHDLPISLRDDHYTKRSECIDYYVKLYGYNPLLYSQFRADSVLYRTKLTKNEERCFRLI